MGIKKTEADKGIPIGLTLGLIAGFAIIFLGTALWAWMIYAGKTGESSAGIAATGISLVSSLVGALVAALYVKKRRLQVCMIFAGCFYLVQIGITALFFGGQYQGTGLGAIVVLTGCAFIAFLPTRKGRAGKYRKKAYR